MNIQKLVSNIINKSKFNSTITIVKFNKSKSTGKVVYQIVQQTDVKVVFSNVTLNQKNSLNLVNNSIKFFYASKDYSQIDNVNFYVIFNELKYNIKSIQVVGVVDNNPTGYTVICQKA